MKRIWAKHVLRREGYCTKHLTPLHVEYNAWDEHGSWCLSCESERKTRRATELSEALALLKGDK